MRTLALSLLLVGCPTPDDTPPVPTPTPPPSPAQVIELAHPACDTPGPPGFDAATPPDFVSVTPPGEEVGGVVVADLDGDFQDEIVVGQRAGGLWIYAYESGQWREDPVELGPGADWYGASVADANGDGRLDVFVAGPDTARLVLQTENGGWTLQDLGLDGGWGAGGTWGDYDQDGDLDLYLLRHKDFEDEHDDDDFADDDDDHADDDDDQTGEGPFFEGAGNGLWRNDGGDFVRQDDAAVSQTPGLTHHARWEDVDRDGDLDLLVLNDGGNFGNNSELWENTGGGWRERGADSFGILENPMGAAVSDLDGNGNVDLWISDIGRTRVFQGAGDWGLIDVGLTWVDPAEHQPADVSWSMIPIDVDGDGQDEVFATYGGLFEPMTNGEPSVRDQPNRVYRHNGTQYASDPTLLPDLPAANSRGAAQGDLNGDGWPDLVVRNIDGPLTVLLGRCNDTNKRVGVRLDDSGSPNRFGVGARVTVNGQVRTMTAGGLGTYSGSGPQLFFGVGDAQTTTWRVDWPDGTVDEGDQSCVDCSLWLVR